MKLYERILISMEYMLNIGKKIEINYDKMIIEKSPLTGNIIATESADGLSRIIDKDTLKYIAQMIVITNTGYKAF